MSRFLAPTMVLVASLALVSSARSHTLVSSDERAIYAAVLKAGWWSPLQEAPREVLVNWETRAPLALEAVDALTVDSAGQKLSGAYASRCDRFVSRLGFDVRDDFTVKNKSVAAIADLPTRRRYKLIDVDWISALTQPPGVIVTFSRAGFDAHRTKALVYVSAWCGGMCASDWYAVFQKSAGEWKLVATLLVGVS